MSSYKKLTCKGTLRQMFVYRLEIQSFMLVFSTQLCEIFPSNLLSSFHLPPCPPSLSQSTVVQTVCGWEGGGVLSRVGDHIPQ
jgi:hypothetical protein